MNWNRDKSIATISTLGALMLAFLMFAGRSNQPIPGPTPTPPNGELNTAKYVIVLRNIDAVTASESAVLDGQMARALKLCDRMVIRPTADQFAKEHKYTTLLDSASSTIVFAVTADGHQVGSAIHPTDERAFQAFCKSVLKDCPIPAITYAEARVQPALVQHDVRKDEHGDYIDIDGHKRRLNARSDPAQTKQLRKYGDHNTLIPQSQWIDIDRRNFFKGEDWIDDQDGIGECVGCGWSGAMRRVRRLEGSSDVKLSPAYVYSQINNDEDNGAIISHGIAATKDEGTCPYALLGIKPFYKREIPSTARAEAYRFKTLDVYRCDSWDELCSAIQSGFIPVYGYMVGNNFEHYDRYGVAGHDRGQGNHCNHAEGMKRIGDGRWVLIDVNSWNYSWGPFKDGRVYLDEKHLFGNGDQPDVCVIRSCVYDPKDARELPVLVTK